MQKFLNLTPHAIVVKKTDGEQVTFEPSGTLARVQDVVIGNNVLGGFEFVKLKKGDVEGLPEFDQDTTLIVSGLVLEAAKAQGRKDCVAPRTDGTAIRNDKGHIVAVCGFVV